MSSDIPALSRFILHGPCYPDRLERLGGGLRLGWLHCMGCVCHGGYQLMFQDLARPGKFGRGFVLRKI